MSHPGRVFWNTTHLWARSDPDFFRVAWHIACWTISGEQNKFMGGSFWSMLSRSIFLIRHKASCLQNQAPKNVAWVLRRKRPNRPDARIQTFCNDIQYYQRKFGNLTSDSTEGFC